MAEVGVLNLTIHDNSSEAAKGLKSLAGALDRIKNAVGTGLGLSTVNDDLKKFAQTVNRQPVTLKIINSITKLGDSLSKLSKITSAINFDVKPLAELKKAVGDGINIKGNPGIKIKDIRDAMAGDWGGGSAIEHMKNLKKAADGFTSSNTATVLNDVSKALERYNKAAATMPGLSKEFEKIQNTVLGDLGHGQMKTNLQQFGGKKTTAVAEQLKMDLDSLAVMSNDLERTEESVHRATEAITQFGNVARVELRETGDIVESVVINRFQEMYRMLGELSDRLGMFRNQFAQLMGGGSPLAIGDGSVPGVKLLTDGADNFLSTWVDTGEKWRQNWVEWSSDVAQEMRNAFKPDWTYFDEGVDKAKVVEEALRRVEVMKKALFSKIENGEIGKDEALRIAEQIEAFEKSIPIIQEVKTVVHDVSQTASKDFTSMANAAKNSAEMTAHDMARIIAIRKEWATMSPDRKEYVMEMFKDNPAVSEALKQMDSIVASSKSVENAMQKVSNKTGDVANTVRGRTVPALKDLDNEMKRKKTDASEAASGFEQFKAGLNHIKEGTKKLFSPLTKLGKQFVNIARRMAIRAIIRQFTQGLREGVENLYNYSKAAKTSFAPAMDEAATSLQQMKNSLGAAVAPAIQALIPILQTVVNWVITGLNYLNQFFALLNGQQTWTRALPATTTAFGKQEKAAKGAAAAVKDLLADWDELNIIQSESGNGGSTGSGLSPEDYLKMFEEVNEFDSKVKDVFEAILDNIDTIKKVAEEVGVAILAWKVSTAFAGVIGTLAGFVATGALIAIEFDVSTFMNKKFIETGDEGWLVGSVLTALLGAALMNKVLKKVLGGKLAVLAIPLALSVDVASRTKVLLDDTDVSAISKESLEANAVSALETGAAAAYLAKVAGGYSLGASIAGGTVAAVATFGVLIGLKADVDAIKNNEITDDTIKAKALEGLALSLSAATVAKLLVPGVSIAQAAGFGLAVGSAAVLLTSSVTIGIMATTQAVKSGITEDVLKKNAVSSLLMAGGIAIVGLMGGAGVAGAIALAGGAAIVTYGILVGVQTLLQPVKSEYDDKRIAVDWGNKKLTQEEIQSFVDTQVFSVKLPVAISLVKSKIEESNQADEELTDKAGDILPIINALTLGFDISGSLDELDKEVFGKDGLLEKYNASIKGKKAEINAALVLVPMKDNEGNDVSADYLREMNEGWSKIDGIMADLGKSLSDSMRDAYDENLDSNLREMAQKSVASITATMLEISTTITASEAKIKAKRSFEEGFEGIAGEDNSGFFSRDTLEALLKYYNEQKDAAREAMEEAYQVHLDDIDVQMDANEHFLELAQQSGNGEYAGRTIEYYEGEIERLKELREKVEEWKQQSIDTALAFYESGDGMDKMREAIATVLSRRSDSYNVERFKGALIGAGSSIGGKITEEPDLTHDQLMRLVETELSSMLYTFYTDEDARLIKDYINAGILQYSDVFSDNIINQILASAFGIDTSTEAGEKLRAQMANLFAEAFGRKPVLDEEAMKELLLGSAHTELSELLTGMWDVEGGLDSEQYFSYMNYIEDLFEHGKLAELEELLNNLRAGVLIPITIEPEIDDLVKKTQGFTTEDEWDLFYNNMLSKDVNDWESYDYVESAIKAALDEYINANGGSYDNFFGFDFAGIGQSLLDAGYDINTILLALEDVLSFAHYNQRDQQYYSGYDAWLGTWEDRENQDFYKINPNFQGTLVNYAGATGMVGEGTTEADMAKATEDGTNAANGDHWTTVEGLIRRLILEMPKEFKISPTSNWGLFNRNANEAAAAVTGDVP